MKLLKQIMILPIAYTIDALYRTKQISYVGITPAGRVQPCKSKRYMYLLGQI